MLPILPTVFINVFKNGWNSLLPIIEIYIGEKYYLYDKYIIQALLVVISNIVNNKKTNNHCTLVLTFIHL